MVWKGTTTCPSLKGLLYFTEVDCWQMIFSLKVWKMLLREHECKVVVPLSNLKRSPRNPRRLPASSLLLWKWIYERSYIWTAEKDMKKWLIVALIQCVYLSVNRFPTTWKDGIRTSSFVFRFPTLSEKGIQNSIFVFNFLTTLNMEF